MRSLYRTVWVLYRRCMLRLNKKVEYGLMALLYLDENGQSSARDIASASRIPLAILGKVLQALTRAGLVLSVQGARGGYRLTQDLEEINLRQVDEAIAGPVLLTSCQSPGGRCNQFDVCTVKPQMASVQSDLLHFVENVRLSKFRTGGKLRKRDERNVRSLR